jgi:hypothetical protein
MRDPARKGILSGQRSEDRDGSYRCQRDHAAGDQRNRNPRNPRSEAIVDRLPRGEDRVNDVHIGRLGLVGAYKAQSGDQSPGDARPCQALRAPQPRPRNLFAVPVNYHKHQQEMGGSSGAASSEANAHGRGAAFRRLSPRCGLCAVVLVAFTRLPRVPAICGAGPWVASGGMIAPVTA